jgi:hypothetical protein
MVVEQSDAEISCYIPVTFKYILLHLKGIVKELLFIHRMASTTQPFVGDLLPLYFLYTEVGKNSFISFTEVCRTSLNTMSEYKLIFVNVQVFIICCFSYPLLY